MVVGLSEQELKQKEQADIAQNETNVITSEKKFREATNLQAKNAVGYMAQVEALLPGLEYDGTNYLYNLQPKANNLFYVGNLSLDGAKDPRKTDGYTLPNTRFRVNKISFPFTSLSFDEPSGGRPFSLFKSAKIGDTCSITWVEDAKKTVERYHHFWCNQWYHRKQDCIPVGSTGKFKGLTVFPFKLKAIYADETPYVNQVNFQALYCIRISKLAPLDLKNIEYDMGTPGSPLVTYEYIIKGATIESRKLTPQEIDVLGEGIDDEIDILSGKDNGVFTGDILTV